MSKRLVAVGDQNGIRKHEQYCPKCGRFGLEIHYGGDDHHHVSGGEIACNSYEDYFSCPTCGYSGDGELVPPEVRDINDLDIYEEV